MTNREDVLLNAIDGMADQFPNYDDQVVGLLISDESEPGREGRLLRALVKMVDRLLEHRDGQVDTLAQSAGEHAIEALAAFGLMEFVYTTRFARWTPDGRIFLAETLQRWPTLRAGVAIRRQQRQLKWTKRATVGVSVVMFTGFIVWLSVWSLGPH
jgi:hypothetical protein